MSIPNESKTIAKMASQAFGGERKVYRYWDNDDNSSVDILSAVNRPYEGITSFSTIGLSNHSINYVVEEKPLRIEIVGACATKTEYFPNVLSTCAFNIINSGYSCAPGTIFRGVINMYYKNSEMEHVMFAPPFLWDESLKRIDFPNKLVVWLLAVPISEKEYLFAKENGTDQLESLFEDEQIDIFDIERGSVL